MLDCDGTGDGQTPRAAGLVPSAVVPRRRGGGAPPGRWLHVSHARSRRRDGRRAAPDDSPGARISAAGLRLSRLPSRLAADGRVPDALFPLRALRRSGPVAGLRGPVEGGRNRSKTLSVRLPWRRYSHDRRGPRRADLGLARRARDRCRLARPRRALELQHRASYRGRGPFRFLRNASVHRGRVPHRSVRFSAGVILLAVGLSVVAFLFRPASR